MTYGHEVSSIEGQSDDLIIEMIQLAITKGGYTLNEFLVEYSRQMMLYDNFYFDKSTGRIIDAPKVEYGETRARKFDGEKWTDAEN